VTSLPSSSRYVDVNANGVRIPRLVIHVGRQLRQRCLLLLCRRGGSLAGHAARSVDSTQAEHMRREWAELGEAGHCHDKSSPRCTVAFSRACRLTPPNNRPVV